MLTRGIGLGGLCASRARSAGVCSSTDAWRNPEFAEQNRHVRGLCCAGYDSETVMVVSQHRTCHHPRPHGRTETTLGRTGRGDRLGGPHRWCYAALRFAGAGRTRRQRLRGDPRVRDWLRSRRRRKNLHTPPGGILEPGGRGARHTDVWQRSTPSQNPRSTREPSRPLFCPSIFPAPLFQRERGMPK